MSVTETRAAQSLAAIFAFRMLGLFMILPVFALYAQDLAGVTPLRIGIAIGIYGLTQGLLQIPFGMLSDRYGRKPLLYLGMIIFAIGSLIAGSSDSIEGVIIGRAVQGAGAVAAVIMALLADLTSEEHRTRAMAFIGISIGFSFIGAMALGPLLSSYIGVNGLFYFTALLALVGMATIYFIVPNPAVSRFHRDTALTPQLLAPVLANSQLLRLNLGIMILHMVLTATFVVIPLQLRDMGLAAADHGYFYLPVMLVGMLLMVPLVIIAESKRQMKPVFVGAILLLLLAVLGINLLAHSLWIMGVMLALYFTAFNLLEATLPSLVSKYTPVTSKGTAMGVYTSSQFLGAFLGGAMGGYLHGAFDSAMVLYAAAGLLLLWALAALTMESPRYLLPRLLNVGALTPEAEHHLFSLLGAVKGVVDVDINREEGIAYLKVDSKHLDEAALLQYSRNQPSITTL
ncbi:MAG: MFS transporter [Gammaproteobacteria bacterium]|nr:MFS transporter [Gammaproteobacteria bacterium]